MNKHIAPIALVCAMSLSACATVPTTATETTLATATLANATGQNVGTAEIVRGSAGVMLRARVSGQAAGDHGIHLHATGKCEAPAFTSAGAHLNPDAHQHGSLNPAGRHAGDLPNIMVAQDGNGMIESALTGFAPDIAAYIFDADGTAVVLHTGPDDYKSDPSGNSGGRIACGVFTRAGS